MSAPAPASGDRRLFLPDRHPTSRVIAVTVNPLNVGLRIYAHELDGRSYVMAISHEQLAQIAHLAAEARRGAFAPEFITGADDRALAALGLAASEAPALPA